MKSKIRFAVLLLIMLFVFISCAGLQLDVNDPVTKFINLSPQNKAAVLMEKYVEVYDEVTNTLAPLSTATPEQKAIAVEKAKILIKAQPAIKMYLMIVNAGATPTAADEEAIVQFVRDLVAKGVNF